MRIATDYEIDSHTRKIIRPGEIIFDEVSITKQINSKEKNAVTETGENTDINKNNENKQEGDKETTEQKTEGNPVDKIKKSRKSVLPEIN